MISLSLRRTLGTALGALVIATAACGGDGGPSGPKVPSDISGSYALANVRTLGKLNGGGKGLPVTFTDGSGSKLTFKSGSLVLAADGTYTLEVQADFNGNDVAMTDEGTYNLAGTTVDFDPTSSPARMNTATVNGASMIATTQFGGIPFEIVVRK